MFGSRIMRYPALLFLAAQLCLSYAAAASPKLASTSWRGEDALSKILSTATYGSRLGLRGAATSFPTRNDDGHVVIFMECTFPVVLVAPDIVAVIYIVWGISFHVIIAVTMGLNNFLWAFLAAYPALPPTPACMSASVNRPRSERTWILIVSAATDERPGCGSCLRVLRLGTFEPATIPKHVRRLDGLSGNVISLCAKGMTTGDIQTHLAEVYDTEISRETTTIVEDMLAWQHRTLDTVYAVLLIDCTVVEIRGSQVANGPVYVAIRSIRMVSVTCSLWVGPPAALLSRQW